jgi:hypothetical protein
MPLLGYLLNIVLPNKIDDTESTSKLEAQQQYIYIVVAFSIR